MDPTEITKHIPEVVSVAKVAAASIPFTAIVKRMLGPAADELAEMWKDQVRIYRYERQVKLLEKVEKIAKDGNLTLGPVPPKILFPLLEGASFEEDETLHDMWAALLANAASLENAEKVRPGFIATLKQMAPDEARVLSVLFDIDNRRFHLGTGELMQCEHVLGWNEGSRYLSHRFRLCIDGLEAEKLLDRSYLTAPTTESSANDEIPIGYYHYFSARGKTFLEACRPPKPKS